LFSDISCFRQMAPLGGVVCSASKFIEKSFRAVAITVLCTIRRTDWPVTVMMTYNETIVQLMKHHGLLDFIIGDASAN